MSALESRVALPNTRSTPYGTLRAAPFPGDRTLPVKSEVVIVGGGIMGVTIAYYLAQRKIPVVVCEKAEIACEASSRAFGWISELLLDPVNQPMAQESKRLWPQLHAEVGETGYRRRGLVYLAETEADLEFYSGWLKHSEGLISPDTAIMSAAQVAERFPTATRSFLGGLIAPSDGSAEPQIAATAVAQAARRAGAKILTGCAVRGLDLKAGRVAGVFTERGYIATSNVVCAANAWSRLFCGNHGVDVPQIYVIMTMGRTGPTAGPAGSGGCGQWAWRQQIDGAYSLGGLIDVHVPVTRDAFALRKSLKPLIALFGGGKLDFGRDAWNDLRLPRRWNPQRGSPFETLRVIAGKPNKTSAPFSFERNSQVFPEMASTLVAETWCGPVTVTLDNKSIIGPVDAIPGFHVVTGASFGISWAPAIGKAMSQVIAGDAPCFDIAPFRLSRFTDGSKLEIVH